jgi:hypothetical protein
MEKDVKALKDKMKRDLQKERERRRRELQNSKVRFPKHIIHVVCVPLFSHSTQCCSHVLRLLTQVHITINYILHFRSNNFNYFASKFPKAALSQEIRARLEFSNFQK